MTTLATTSGWGCAALAVAFFVVIVFALIDPVARWAASTDGFARKRMPPRIGVAALSPAC